jgi:hypothetical protein
VIVGGAGEGLHLGACGHDLRPWHLRKGLLPHRGIVNPLV